uniref:FAR1 domain-containing protein n=1 Tax=Trichobilharzia regenti TaxID=157069 RepID=A0AA85JLQ2_TRIRE|nr:unnamed protein product [Trichobilharzia regenti]
MLVGHVGLQFRSCSCTRLLFHLSCRYTLLMHMKMFPWQKQLFPVCLFREKIVFLVHVCSMQQSASESVKENTIRVCVSQFLEKEIKAGEFRTWVEVEKALKLFQKLTNTRYIVRESKLNKDEPHVQYAYGLLVCTFGYKRKSQSNHIRLKGSKYIGCPSVIHIRYHCNKLIVSSVYMIHNHCCTHEYLMKDDRARKLDESEVSIIKPMLSISSEPEKTIDYVAEQFKKRMTYNDLPNIRAAAVEDCDLQSVIFSRLRQVRKLVVIRDETDGRMKIACFSSSRQIKIHHKFPEVDVCYQKSTTRIKCCTGGDTKQLR